MWGSLWLALFAFILPWRARTVPIKVIEGVEPIPPSSVVLAPLVGLPQTDDFPPAGPAFLALLANKCYRLAKQKFEYEFCPFANVTQRRVIGTAGTLLGAWNGIFYSPPPPAPGSRAVGLVQEYNLGTHCRDGRSYRSRVGFMCRDDESEASHALVEEEDDDPPFELSGVSTLTDSVDGAEGGGCVFAFQFETPFPCGLLRVGTAGAGTTQGGSNSGGGSTGSSGSSSVSHSSNIGGSSTSSRSSSSISSNVSSMSSSAGKNLNSNNILSSSASAAAPDTPPALDSPIPPPPLPVEALDPQALSSLAAQLSLLHAHMQALTSTVVCA